MVNRMPKRSKTLIAPKYFTTMEASFQGVLGITATQLQYFDISAFDLARPFFCYEDPSGATNTGFTTMTGSALLNTTGVVESIMTAGFDTLSLLYNKYRVHASKLRITMTPTAGADVLDLCVCPWAGAVTTSGSYPNTFYEARAQPYSKVIQCTGNNNIKQNTLIHKQKNRTLLGLSKEQYRADLDNCRDSDVLTGSRPTEEPNGQAGNPLFWRVYYAKYSSGVFTAPVAVSVNVTYYVEWLQPKNNQEVLGPD